MALRWKTIDLPFTGGMNQKIAENMIRPPVLTEALNVSYNSAGGIQVRGEATAPGTGIAGGGTLGTVQGLYTYKDELLCYDKNDLYSYDPDNDEWIRKAYFAPVSLTAKVIAKRKQSQDMGDRAVDSNVALVAWREDSKVYYAVYNNTTGAQYGDVQSISNSDRPRCRALNSKLLLFYEDTSATAVKCIVIDPTDVLGTYTSAAVTTASDLDADGMYNVSATGHTSDRLAIVYHSSSTTPKGRIGVLDSTGAVQGSLTTSTDDWDQAIGLGVDYNSNAAVYAVATMSSANNCIAETFNSALVSQATLSKASSLATANVNAVTCKLMTVSESSSYRLVWFLGETNASSQPTTTRVTSMLIDGTDKTDYQTGDIGWGGAICAEPWVDDAGDMFFMTRFEDTDQSMYIVFKLGQVAQGALEDGQEGEIITARFLAGKASTQLSDKGWLAHTFEESDEVWATMCNYRVRLNTNPTDSTATDAPPDEANAAFSEDGLRVVKMDGTARPPAAELGDALYIASGCIWQYDGVNITEDNHFVWPTSDLTLSSGGTSGSLDATGTYSYQVYFEWVNAQGETAISTRANPENITLTATHNETDFAIPAWKFSRRENLSTINNNIYAIYRTEGAPNVDSPYYRVTDPDPSTSGDAANGWNIVPASGTKTWIDRLSDANLIKKELAYTNTGELDNVAGPCATILTAGKNRLFAAGGELDGSTVQFSKLKLPGRCVEWNESLTLEVPKTGGDITALAVLDENLIIFKKERIYMVAGDGPNNFGVGSFSQAQLISSEQGCKTQKSVAITSDGLVFQSLKGMQLLTRGMQVSYWGAPIEKVFRPHDKAGTSGISNFDVQSVLVYPEVEEIRVANNHTASSAFSQKMAIYHTGARQWSMSSIYGTPSDQVLFDNVAYHLTSGALRKEVRSNGNTSFRIKTGWIRLTSIAGYQRLRKIGIVGTAIEQSDWSFTLYYDYNISSSEVITAINNTQSKMFEIHVPRQKCSSIMIEITCSVADGNNDAGYILNGLSLEVGTKKGIGRQLAVADRTG